MFSCPKGGERVESDQVGSFRLYAKIGIHGSERVHDVGTSQPLDKVVLDLRRWRRTSRAARVLSEPEASINR